MVTIRCLYSFQDIFFILRFMQEIWSRTVIKNLALIVHKNDFWIISFELSWLEWWKWRRFANSNPFSNKETFSRCIFNRHEAQTFYNRRRRLNSTPKRINIDIIRHVGALHVERCDLRCKVENLHEILHEKLDI